MCQPFADFFTEAASVLKSRVVDIQVGGPVLCWPITVGFQKGSVGSYTWYMWTKPLLDTAVPAGVLDFLDFHAYGQETNSVIHDMMLANAYTLSRFGVSLPTAVTETSYELSEGENGTYNNRTAHLQRRTLLVLRDLLAYAAQPDKAKIRQEHDLGAMAGGAYKFNNDPATPEMQLYRALKPLRGKRMEAILHQNAGIEQDVLTEVVHNRDIGSLVLVAANFENHEIKLALQIENLQAWMATMPLPVSTATWQVRVFDTTSLRPVAPPIAVDSIMLAPQSLTVITIPVNESRQASRSVRWREYVSPAVMELAPHTASQVTFTTTINVSNVSAAPTNTVDGVGARLRVGMKGDAVRCDSWGLSVGGSAPFNWVPPATFRAGGCPPTSDPKYVNCTEHLQAGETNVWGEVPIPEAVWTPRIGVLELELKSCLMTFARSPWPQPILTFVSLLVLEDSHY